LIEGVHKQLKNLTTKISVKIISFILVLALSFLILNRLYAFTMKISETGVSPEIILSDLSTNQYFFSQNMPSVYYYVYQIVQYKSVASIEAGEHFKWNWSEYWDGDKRYYVDALTDIHTGETFTSFETADESPERRAEAEKYAVQNQLNTFTNALTSLSGIDGLIYYIDTGAGAGGADPGQSAAEGGRLVYSNVDSDMQTAGNFKAQPVYYIVDGQPGFESSHPIDLGYAYAYIGYSQIPNYGMLRVYLAFTASAVNMKTSVYTAARDAYMYSLGIIVLSALLLIALLVLLLAGAGRRDKAGRGMVHIALIDRPFLDISLAVVACWVVFAVILAANALRTVKYSASYTAVNVIFAILSVIVVTPSLLWLLTLAKRMKAGRFWRHALIYFIPSRFLRFCARVAKSFWAGQRLTSKVVLISLASFIAMLLVGWGGMLSYYNGGILMWIEALVFAVIIAFLLMRYAGRIHKLDLGARVASGGEYDAPISAGGGELGSIAASINNISAGINTAVEQRMKSERLKTELITNVSHDIRTPLTSIITYTDLLRLEGLDCEKAPEYLDVLVQKSQRLKTLTDELFEAAKASTGNIEVHISELDIVSLINQVLGELDGAIKSSGLDLRVRLPERQAVNADGKLMWRVMENLLSNVFKYSLPGSRVYLDVDSAGNSLIRIDLKNISATELNVDPAELTERFKRGDDSRADGGSGLGLSIVQSFVGAQGGRFEISIDGDLFKASVFLPAV